MDIVRLLLSNNDFRNDDDIMIDSLRIIFIALLELEENNIIGDSIYDLLKNIE